MAREPSGVRGWRLTVATLAAVAGIALMSGIVALLKPHVPVLSLDGLYVLVVLPVAVAWGLADRAPRSPSPRC